MNQNIVSIFYLVAGFVALIFASGLLMQIGLLFVGIYCLYKGFSLRGQQPPQVIVVMRNAYRQFFGGRF